MLTWREDQEAAKSKKSFTQATLVFFFELSREERQRTGRTHRGLTEAEVDAHPWITGGDAPAAGRWRPIRRFAIRQKGKDRPCDHARESLHNATTRSSESLAGQATADAPASIARAFAVRHGSPVDMEGSTADWPKAYRKSPVRSPRDNVVAVWNPYEGRRAQSVYFIIPAAPGTHDRAHPTAGKRHIQQLARCTTNPHAAPDKNPSRMGDLATITTQTATRLRRKGPHPPPTIPALPPLPHALHLRAARPRRRQRQVGGDERPSRRDALAVLHLGDGPRHGLDGPGVEDAAARQAVQPRLDRHLRRADRGREHRRLRTIGQSLHKGAAARVPDGDRDARASP